MTQPIREIHFAFHATVDALEDISRVMPQMKELATQWSGRLRAFIALTGDAEEGELWELSMAVSQSRPARAGRVVPADARPMRRGQACAGRRAARMPRGRCRSAGRHLDRNSVRDGDCSTRTDRTDDPRGPAALRIGAGATSRARAQPRHAAQDASHRAGDDPACTRHVNHEPDVGVQVGDLIDRTETSYAARLRIKPAGPGLHQVAGAVGARHRRRAVRGRVSGGRAEPVLSGGAVDEGSPATGIA